MQNPKYAVKKVVKPKSNPKAGKGSGKKQMVGMDTVATELSIASQMGVSLRDRRIFLVGDIDEESYSKFLAVFTVLDAFNAPISISLCTDGGDMGSGLAIYDLIKTAQNKVTIDVMGNAHSIGALILQAADHRRILPNSTIMLHQGAMFTVGENKFKAAEISEHASDLKQKNEKYYQIIADATDGKLSFKDVVRVCKKDTYYSAEEALSNGLVDEIIQPTKK